MAGCRKGRESDQQAFYERLYGYALSVCLAYAADREEAREMVNDGFLKAFRAMPDLQSEEAVRPWFRRILVNTAIDYHRRRERRMVEEHLTDDTSVVAEPHWNDETITAQLSAEDILATLARLPSPYRMVFSLYVIEGYSHAEIAEQLGLAESTSRSHLTQANRLMRQALTRQNNPDYERTN